VAQDIGLRLARIFLRGPDGTRSVHGGQPLLQNDPYWRDLLLFYEYLQGDYGAGIGASHLPSRVGSAGSWGNATRLEQATSPMTADASNSLSLVAG
jgi:hypothetical protein